MTDDERAALIAAEEWRPVPGCPGYWASSEGRVRSSRSGAVLNGFVDHDGYRRVSIRCDGRTLNRSVHRLIAEVFIGQSSLEIDHIDGDRLNNHVSNLRYCTHAENNRFTAEAGRGARGETNIHARLTESDVLAIRAFYRRGHAPFYNPQGLSVLGVLFRCSEKAIHHIVIGSTWKHLPMELTNG